MNDLIQTLNNVKSAPQQIAGWGDIWCALVFWSKIDSTYAGNMFLSHISEQTTPCSIADLNDVILWLTANDLMPILNTETKSINWIRDAVTLHAEMIQRSTGSL